MNALYGNWFWECRGHNAMRGELRPFRWERLWEIVMILRTKPGGEEG